MAEPIYTSRGYSYNNEPYFRVETAEVEEGLLKFSVTARRAVKAYLKEVGVPMLEGYAKANAPWTDRTGSARQGITASVYEKGRANNNRLQQDYTCGVQIYHTALNARGQKYGKFLEYVGENGMGVFNVRTGKYNKPYPILEPTARIAGAEVVHGMMNIIEKYDGSVFGVDDLIVDVDNSMGERE